MTDLSPQLEAFGLQLRDAYGRRLRRRRITRTIAASAAAVLVLAAAAFASGIAGDLYLDPTKWEILGSGTVNDGKGEYVHAKERVGGRNSTFMVEHDADISDRYDAFLLHEKLKAEANRTSPVPVRTETGPLCSRDELMRAEQTALDALRAGVSPGEAVQAAFADNPCRGLEYGTEIAARVFAGKEPASHLMPGVK